MNAPRTTPSRRAGTHSPVCGIAPPYLLALLAERGTQQQQAAAAQTLIQSAAIRARRAAMGSLMQALPDSPQVLGVVAGEHLSVFDANHGGDADLPGALARSEADPAVGDVSVNEAFDGADLTYAFYQDVFGRDSVDGAGLALVSSVHYGTDFDNAFWNGSQMVYGDGSGHLFAVGALTRDLDVIAHELTHGVTQYTANLSYHQQSGALNESMSDVFGSLVKQRHLGQTADQADWLIGEGLLGDALNGVALRSMAAPGTAFDGDPQPSTMAGYVDLPDDDDPHHDHGGVHINSGIPNHVFYLVATTLGGNAWEAPGQIWYDTLTSGLASDADFKAAAQATTDAAINRYGDGSPQQQAVTQAWQTVGVL